MRGSEGKERRRREALFKHVPFVSLKVKVEEFSADTEFCPFSFEGWGRRGGHREAREQKRGGGGVVDAMGDLEASVSSHERCHRASDAPRSRDREMDGAAGHAEGVAWGWGVTRGGGGSGRRQRGGEQQRHQGEGESGSDESTRGVDGSASSRRGPTSRRRNHQGPPSASRCECPDDWRGGDGGRDAEVGGTPLPLRPEGRKRMHGWGGWAALTAVITVLFFIVGATQAEWVSGNRQGDGEYATTNSMPPQPTSLTPPPPFFSFPTHSYISARGGV